LQPETPPEGRLLSDKFRPEEITAMFQHLRQRGKRYNMVFNHRERSSNSRLALLAGEFAHEMGRFEEFHENIFRAFFTDLQDIGQFDVILKIASQSRLDPEALTQALNEGRHQARLETAATEARRLGIRSIPAFVSEKDEIIFGALSPEIFRKSLASIEDGTYRNPLI
jgi:predicted DsbA family dithiol-disulfide isomerase